MKLLFYGYDRCGSCIKAIKFLEGYNIDYQKIAIRENPPKLKEIKRMFKEVKRLNKLFNTSGKDYREGGWKEKIHQLSEKEVLEALSKNGNLIKRPFVLSADEKILIALVGFKNEEWEAVFSAFKT